MRRLSCAGLLLCLCWLAASVSIAAAEPPPPLSQNVAAALAEGYQIGGAHSESALRQLDQVQSTAPRDPRIGFAAGLVHFKQLRVPQAEQEFERATRMEGTPYWPAWRAWVWCAFRGRDLKTGVARLEALVKRIEEQQDGPAVQAVIAWSGQVLSAVQRTETDERSQAKLIAVEHRVRAVLRDDLEEVFDEGVISIKEVENRLREHAESKRQQAESRLRAKRKAVRVAQEQLGNQQNAMARSAEEWKMWRDAQMAQLEKHLAKRDVQSDFLRKQAGSLDHSIRLAEVEYGSLELQLKSFAPRTRPMATAAAIEQMNQLDQQLRAYRAEFRTLQLNLRQVDQQRAAFMMEKGQVETKYTEAITSLTRAKSRLAARTRQAALKEPPARSTVDSGFPGRLRFTFLELVPFDPLSARDEVLGDLQVQDADNR